MPDMQPTADEEVLELLKRYAAFLAESTAPGSLRAEAAARWEKRFSQELKSLRAQSRPADAKGVTGSVSRTTKQKATKRSKG